MLDASRMIRCLVTALSFALALATARPAAACAGDEDPCGGGCIPSGDECCGSDGVSIVYCPHGTACTADQQCLLGVGPSGNDLIIEANGAPYGPSLPRSCAMGAGSAGSEGAMTLLLLGSLALARRVRRRGARA